MLLFIIQQLLQGRIEKRHLRRWKFLSLGVDFRNVLTVGNTTPLRGPISGLVMLVRCVGLCIGTQSYAINLLWKHKSGLLHLYLWSQVSHSLTRSLVTRTRAKLSGYNTNYCLSCKILWLWFFTVNTLKSSFLPATKTPNVCFISSINSHKPKENESTVIEE